MPFNKKILRISLESYGRSGGALDQLCALLYAHECMHGSHAKIEVMWFTLHNNDFDL